MTNKLKIATWNANGLQKHISELGIYLKNENIDICLISETHFTKQSYVKIPHYLCYHTPHPENKARGGSAILIKNNMQHYEELKLETLKMQATTISIKANNKEIKISAIYCPPRLTLSIDEYKDVFEMLGNNFIIGGDFNAKHTHWGSRLTNPKGKKLYQAARNHKCQFFSSGSPTYWPSDSEKVPDLIDFFITKGISKNHVIVKGGDDLSSDHTPIILTLSANVIKSDSLPKLSSNRTNWEMFREKLHSFINIQFRIVTIDQIDKEVEQLIADIQQAAEESTPPPNARDYKGISYPADVREMILAKRKARRKWQQSRSPDDKTILNHLNNVLMKRIKEFKNESIGRFLNYLTDDVSTNYSLWKVAKRLNRPVTQNPPLKMKDGNWAKSSKQKANLFADHLEEVFTPLPANSNVDTINTNNNSCGADIPYVTLKEIKNMIKYHISEKKSPGYDLITGKIMKELPELALLKFQHIINACFKIRYVPKHWKIAEIIVIPKPGKPPTEVTSYRPISLLPTMSKIFERLLLKRLSPIIREQNLIPSHQFGFRNKHSTIDQVHRITNTIEKALEEKKVCSAVFLDVAQAFDKVWHDGLKYKLHRDLPRPYYELLSSYLEERFFRVRYDKDYSDLKNISAGVPQGSVLGPVLYLLFTADIPLDKNVMMATFADDTAILATDKSVNQTVNNLQTAMNKIHNWTQRWRIKLNETKSTHINFTYKKVVSLQIYIDGHAIPITNTAKYLGMTLDVKLKWNEHVKKKKEELKAKYRKLYWLMGRNSELSIHNKIKLYNQILKPIWSYGIQLWGCTKKTNLYIIQTFQNKVLRNIVNAPWYIRNKDLHRDLQIKLVSDEVKKFAVKHNQRLQVHQNQELESVLDVTNNIRRLKRTKPHELTL